MKRHKNNGFSLMELVVTISILAVLMAVLVPAYMTISHNSRIKKDDVKFESICTSFKTALAEPEVQKEIELLGGGKVQVTFPIESTGRIVFGNGELIGSIQKDWQTSSLWLNSYQSVGIDYNMENIENYGKYVVFTLTPKTDTTTAKCTYEISDTKPSLTEEES